MRFLKSAGAFAIGAACLSFAAGSAMARGYGQGEHEVDSGYGQNNFGGGYSGGSGVAGQGQEGPNGSNGAYVYSGIDNAYAGQGQHEVGGGFQTAPAFEPTPIAEQGAMIATNQPVQPENGVQIAGDSHYRFTNGMWFYQMPNNSWVRWENGGWREYNANAIASENSGANAARIFSYEPSKTGGQAKNADHGKNAGHGKTPDKNVQKPAEQKQTQQK